MKILKILWLLILCVVLNANDFEWVKLYEEGGAKAIEQKINALLQTRAFWSEVLKEKDTRFGYYEDLRYLFIATKNAPTLRLYASKDGIWEEKLNTESLVGSKNGNKQKEGDLATPIGVYTLNGRLVDLPQFYGPLAFPTNYPNLYDRLQNRTGYGIWIHGLPLDGNRDINTQGCIAIDNDKLSGIDRLIDYRNALLITYENAATEVKKEDLSALLADLYLWREAWKVNDIEKYLGFYDRDFIRFDGIGYENFAQNKRRIFARNERKEIIFSKINIAPYPNDDDKNMYRITFSEDYRSPSYKFSGQKELYVELKDSKMQIIVER